MEQDFEMVREALVELRDKTGMPEHALDRIEREVKRLRAEVYELQAGTLRDGAEAERLRALLKAYYEDEATLDIWDETGVLLGALTQGGEVMDATQKRMGEVIREDSKLIAELRAENDELHRVAEQATERGMAAEAEAERLRTRVAELEQWAADKPEAERRWLEQTREVERLRVENEALRKNVLSYAQRVSDNAYEVERLRAWQDEVVRGYEFKDADEMLAWVRHIWEEE